MASLYQRFSGQINTNKTFPDPPEASRLLGQTGDPGDRPADSQRARLQPQHRRRRCEDEDVRNSSFTFQSVLGFNMSDRRNYLLIISCCKLRCILPCLPYFFVAHLNQLLFSVVLITDVML
uniref:Uncharacterized protein n=1 Tax=Poecilia latipinna TaxID=48699 RepID=A0A3B3UFB0_9TELE